MLGIEPTAAPVVERDSDRSGWRPIAAPFLETLNGLDRVLDGQMSRMLWVFLGLGIGWWVYVPLHEFLHALGCLATGGEVWELEIARAYGGSLYAALFDFVTPHSEYAGRLSGFDTHGNDLIYLATDLAPYLLTFFPGVWLWRRAATRSQPLVWGAMLPVALAPFVSLTGDAYEIGAILATHIPPWTTMQALEAIRGDDLFLVVERLGSQAGLGLGVALSTVFGGLWAWSWYALSARLAKKLGVESVQIEVGSPT